MITKLVGFIEFFLFFAILFRHFRVENERRGHCFFFYDNRSLIFGDDRKMPALGSTATVGNSVHVLFGDVIYDVRNAYWRVNNK